MRSDFFNEIAESRERFYRMKLGERSESGYIQSENECGRSVENNGEKIEIDPNSGMRRELLLDFLGKVKFMVGL